MPRYTTTISVFSRTFEHNLGHIWAQRLVHPSEQRLPYLCQTAGELRLSKK